MIELYFPWRKIFLLVSVISLASSISFGQTLYSATGKASFYARKFEGRKTASGERFSNKDFTAAHRTLPLGTMVKVTNLVNNKSITVRINDRGPYIKGRIIDLTRAGADSLDFIHEGWVKVRVEELLPELIDTLVAVTSLPDTSVFRFPYDWLGQWKGNLKVYTALGLKQVVPMELHILPTALPDHFTWFIIYDSLPRNYELVLRDSIKGLHSLDEKNGVDLMSYLLGNHFISRFAVDGQMLECEYALESRDELTFEIHAGNYERAWTTGNVDMENESVSKVEVFQVQALQVAELHKVKE